MKHYSIYGICLIALISGCMFFPFLEENIVTYSGNFLSTIFTGKSEIGPRITRYGSDYSPIYVVILLLLVVSSVVGTWKNLTTGIINVLLGLLIALYAIAIGYLFDNKIVVGNIIEHNRFGRGEVLNLEGTGPNKKAEIQFGTVGKKKLLLQFAKLKVIG